MEAFWIALALGLAAPFAISATTIKIAFEERGFAQGIATWLGMAILPTAFCLIIAWLFG